MNGIDLDRWMGFVMTLSSLFVYIIIIFEIRSVCCLKMMIRRNDWWKVFISIVCIVGFSCRGVQALVIRSENKDSNVKPTATRGMVVDAGSGGSRLHVFTWEPRIFNTVPPPLSYPQPNEKWTVRIDPGIQNFANDMDQVADHLIKLIDYAKVALVGFEHEFADYPLYFKATGGMRELTVDARDRIIYEVRRLLSDKSFCPFFFKDEFARVISGEEEAIFSWTATNFLMGTLLPNSRGIGEVNDANTTYGTLDLGGASTQIAFYVPSQNMLEGLYKLQLGGQKQWNVYTKSFLQFGVVSARLRFHSLLADAAVAKLAKKLGKGMPITSDMKISAVNYCFQTGYGEQVADSTGQYQVQLSGPTDSDETQLQKCREAILPIMQKELDSFCNKAYHGDCSLAGAYQPPIPTGKHGHFIGQSSYKYPWNILMLPKTATLVEFEDRAVNICKFSFAEMMVYYETNNLNNGNADKLSDFLPYYCFLSGYVLTLLEDGYRFDKNQTLTVMDEVNGHKVGWALGAILYEINELPWVLKLSPVEKHPIGFAILAGVLGFFIGAVAALFIYREMIENKRPRGESTNEDLKRLDALEDLRKKLSGGPTLTPTREDYGAISGTAGKISPVGREPRDWIHSSWGSQKKYNSNVYDRIPETAPVDESI